MENINLSSLSCIVQNWIEWDTNTLTKEYMIDLYNKSYPKDMEPNLTNKNLIKLANYFILNQRIKFGTAGLRSKMDIGIHNMNEVIIMQTSQGFCDELINSYGIEKCQNNGIIIGYDHRKNNELNLSSERFALLTAAVFISRDIPVYFLNNFVPTPFVPYGILLKNCVGGVMVTASHNPKQDNGYKVYWGNGAQIIKPNDKNIARSIMKEENQTLWHNNYSELMQLENLQQSNLFHISTNEIATNYYMSLNNLSYYKNINNTSDINIIYSAMHGVGYQWMIKAFQELNLPEFESIISQQEPDPEFPTVPKPNPEEKGALDLAIEYANNNNGTLILANDPDADRLAVAEKQNDNTWYVFTGNEIGVLLGYWQFLNCNHNLLKSNEHNDKLRKLENDEKEEIKNNNNNDNENKKIYMLASIVSSAMLGEVAKVEGFEFENTLTGFKWLGNRAIQLQNEGHEVIFSFEEAIGFCCGMNVPDKDGISAGSIFAEMANYLKRVENKNVKEHLDFLYNKYGHFVTDNHYLYYDNPEILDSIFGRLRNSGNYWTECGEYKIKTIRDVTMGYDSSTPDNKCSLPITPSSHMIIYIFENGCNVTFRTSGTEPKLKYYMEKKGEPGISREEVVEELSRMKQILIDNMLEPEKNGLRYP